MSARLIGTLSSAAARDAKKVGNTRGREAGGDVYLLPPNKSTSCCHANRLHKVSKHMDDSTPEIDVGVVMPLVVMAVALGTMAVAMTVGVVSMAVVMIMIMPTHTMMVVATEDEQVEHINADASKC